MILEKEAIGNWKTAAQIHFSSCGTVLQCFPVVRCSGSTSLPVFWNHSAHLVPGQCVSANFCFSMREEWKGTIYKTQNLILVSEIEETRSAAQLEFSACLFFYAERLLMVLHSQSHGFIFWAFKWWSCFYILIELKKSFFFVFFKILQFSICFPDASWALHIFFFSLFFFYVSQSGM